MDSLALYMTRSTTKRNHWNVSLFDSRGEEFVRELHSESLEFENLVDTVLAVMVTAKRKQVEETT